MSKATLSIVLNNNPNDVDDRDYYDDRADDPSKLEKTLFRFGYF